MTPRQIASGVATAGMLFAGTTALFLLGEDANAVRCAVVKGGNFTGKFYLAENECPPDPLGKPGITFLPSPKVAIPSYNNETQVIEGPSYTVGRDEVTESWSVRNKTAEEIDTSKDLVLEGINKAVFLALCHLKNEVRTKVDSLAEWSEAQCLAAFKNLL